MSDMDSIDRYAKATSLTATMWYVIIWHLKRGEDAPNLSEACTLAVLTQDLFYHRFDDKAAAAKTPDERRALLALNFDSTYL